MRVLNGIVFLVTLSLAACSSNPPAPVIDRLPSKSTPIINNPASKPVATNRPTYKPGDWRPDNYIVKKGDTLFSIGLEFGYDYKEIAEANHLVTPYVIKTGQVLKFASLKDATKQENSTDNSGVVTYPISPNGTGTVASTAPAIVITPSIVAITEPKAIREPYSDEAFKKPLPATTTATQPTAKPVIAAAKPVVGSTPAITTAPSTPANTTSANVEDIDWSWPTQGKLIGNFNEANNKGIDIAGSRGQVINAAAAGKVIYSGSDLRGYGKLVIIKHNQNYLSVYAHNNLIVIKEGQKINRGQKIAEMGDTDSNSVKLHFEIRRQGKSVDPMQYLSAN